MAEGIVAVHAALSLELRRELGLPASKQLVMLDDIQLEHLLSGLHQNFPRSLPSRPQRRKAYLAMIREVEALKKEFQAEQVLVERLSLDWPSIPTEHRRAIAAYKQRRAAVVGGAVSRLAELKHSLSLCDDMFAPPEIDDTDWCDAAYSLFWIWDYALGLNAPNVPVTFSEDGPCTRFIESGVKSLGFAFNGTRGKIAKRLERWRTAGHFAVRAGHERDKAGRFTLS